jgi:hypothetical protein
VVNAAVAEAAAAGEVVAAECATLRTTVAGLSETLDIEVAARASSEREITTLSALHETSCAALVDVERESKRLAALADSARLDALACSEELEATKLKLRTTKKVALKGVVQS